MKEIGAPPLHPSFAVKSAKKRRADVIQDVCAAKRQPQTSCGAAPPGTRASRRTLASFTATYAKVKGVKSLPSSEWLKDTSDI